MSTVDTCLNEIDRLRDAKRAAESTLWHAEFLIHRIGKLLPHLIADGPVNAVARDVIADEIREFLEEAREHPGTSALLGDGEVPTSTPGDAEQGGTS